MPRTRNQQQHNKKGNQQQIDRQQADRQSEINAEVTDNDGSEQSHHSQIAPIALLIEQAIDKHRQQSQGKTHNSAPHGRTVSQGAVQFDLSTENQLLMQNNSEQANTTQQHSQSYNSTTLSQTVAQKAVQHDLNNEQPQSLNKVPNHNPVTPKSSTQLGDVMIYRWLIDDADLVSGNGGHCDRRGARRGARGSRRGSVGVVTEDVGMDRTAISITAEAKTCRQWEQGHKMNQRGGENMNR